MRLRHGLRRTKPVGHESGSPRAHGNPNVSDRPSDAIPFFRLLAVRRHDKSAGTGSWESQSMTQMAKTLYCIA